MPRRRVDSLLAERGLLPSRSAAASSVRAGLVRVGRGGELAAKPGQLVADDVELELEPGRRFVSRGGLKLDAALDELAVEVAGADCLDVGASTGGFSDCLLQRGAARVAAVDVGHGQLDWGLRNDERIVVLEGVNARELAPTDLPFAAALATIDVSFISLRKLLAPIAACLAPAGRILAMVKPQFELGRGRVRGGVVRDPAERLEAVLAVATAADELELATLGIAPAGVPGPKGNREVFLLLGPGEGIDDREDLAREAVR